MFMKLYTVFIPQRPIAGEPLFIKEGFNLYAFIFGIFWALYHRLWKLSLLIAAFNLMLIYMSRYHLFAPASLALMQFTFQLIIGYYGNDWWRNKLLARGYIMADLVSGTTLARAWQRYFDRCTTQSF